jgi:hypothetical protein
MLRELSVPRRPARDPLTPNAVLPNVRHRRGWLSDHPLMQRLRQHTRPAGTVSSKRIRALPIAESRTAHHALMVVPHDR